MILPEFLDQLLPSWVIFSSVHVQQNSSFLRKDTFFTVRRIHWKVARIKSKSIAIITLLLVFHFLIIKGRSLFIQAIIIKPISDCIEFEFSTFKSVRFKSSWCLSKNNKLRKLIYLKFLYYIFCRFMHFPKLLNIIHLSKNLLLICPCTRL